MMQLLVGTGSLNLFWLSFFFWPQNYNAPHTHTVSRRHSSRPIALTWLAARAPVAACSSRPARRSVVANAIRVRARETTSPTTSFVVADWKRTVFVLLHRIHKRCDSRLRVDADYDRRCDYNDADDDCSRRRLQRTSMKTHKSRL